MSAHSPEERRLGIAASVDAAVAALAAAAQSVQDSLAEARRLEQELPQAERQRHAAAQRTVREARDRALREAIERRDSRVSAAHARHQRLCDRMREQRSESSGKMEELAETQLEEAQRQYERQLWMAETINDSSSQAPREQYERVRGAVEAASAGARAALRDIEAIGSRLGLRLAPPPAGAQMPAPPPAGAPRSWMSTIQSASEAVTAAQARAQSSVAAKAARPAVLLPSVMGLAVVGALAGLLARAASVPGIPWDGWSVWMAAAATGISAGGVGLAAALFAWSAGRSTVRAAHADAMRAYSDVASSVDAALQEAQRQRQRLEQAREAEHQAAVAQARARWEPVIARITARRAELSRELESRYGDVSSRLDAERDAEIAAAESECAARLEASRRSHDESVAREDAAHAKALSDLSAQAQAHRAAFTQRWRAAQDGWTRSVREQRERLASECPPWEELARDAGAATAPGESIPAAHVARAALDVSALDGACPADATLSWPDGSLTHAALPMCLSVPERGSMLLECGLEGRPEAIGMLQAAVLRLLAALPAGKAQFLLIDPIGMGESFAGLMHLCDETDAIIGGRTWTESRHIEQRLADISEHLETVIQKYLRNEFASLDEYNRRAGEIAEPYRFVVISDYPASISEEASRRLTSIIAGGARCGVHVLVLRDVRHPPTAGMDLQLLRRSALCLAHDGRSWRADIAPAKGIAATAERPPLGPDATAVVRALAQRARSSRRVEVPFSAIAPPEGEMWRESSAASLSVALGRSGATRLQRLILGEGTRQHALIAGRTGSGKSTLLHAMITNLALQYSPDEVELWLIDFKKGVEFRTYATHALPHARVIAIESDREFGISVLQGLDAELKRRGDLFRSCGVQDLPSFRRARPQEPLPRALLVIDEFQELFTEDDHVAQEANALLDRIIRQGRAFGVHAVLGSQTLGGAYTIARTTMGQMGVRIALQCNEADSQLILSDDNLAARLLSRPGEAIYNDAGGLLEGNSPFQVVWLDDRERDLRLSQVSARMAASAIRRPPPIVFEGNATADIAQCAQLAVAATAGRAAPHPTAGSPLAPALWLGDAVAIKEPAHILLSRRGGANVLVVGAREEQCTAMAMATVASVASQCPSSALILVDSATPDQPHHGLLERCARELGMRVSAFAPSDAGEALAEAARMLGEREAAREVTAPAVIVMIAGIQRVRALRRKEDDYSFGTSDAPPSPDRILSTLAREGPAHGVHAWVSVDNGASLGRALDRSGLREFDWRILFQCSASDSSALVDSGIAARLGPQRALLHDELSGKDEKFRPWSLPDPAWISRLGNALRSRATGA